MCFGKDQQIQLEWNPGHEVGFDFYMDAKELLLSLNDKFTYFI